MNNLNKESKFEILNTKIIGTWSYKLSSNVDCTICTYSLNSDSLYNQDKCLESDIIEGICGHTFHQECIKPWITKHLHCPICSKNWIDKK